MSQGEDWVTVANLTDVVDGNVLGVVCADREIAVYNVAGMIYATDNVCTHARALLSDGYLEGTIIECPLHAGQFDVTTGRGQGAPITCDLATYQTRVVGEAIQIRI